jgi:phosphoadenosine phosphosulfate reductase
MRDMERLQHELHASLPAFKRKIDKAKAIIDEALAVMPHPYIALSGGLDSSIVLDLLYAQGIRLDVLWGDDGFDFPETLQFLAATEERYGFRMQRIRCMQPWRDWCHEMDRPDLAHDPEALSAWGNPQHWDGTWQSLKDAPSRGSYSGVFLGLLASESRGRTYALKGGYQPLYQVASEQGMWHCSPLATFDKRDCWAYVTSKGIPYNPVYDRLAELGVPLERRRVAPLTCFRTMQYGSVVALKQGWPELYNRLCMTFPRVRSFS